MFYFHPVRSKEPPIFNFLTLDPAKNFYKMAATAGLSCGEIGINSKNKNTLVFWSSSRNNWMRKLDCVNASISIIHNKTFK